MVFGYAFQLLTSSQVDVLQVVNALLTQLDKLKHKRNVLVMSTSNLAQAIGLYTFLRSKTL